MSDECNFDTRPTKPITEEDRQLNKVPISGNLPKTLNTPAPDMELKENGQHKDYWVLNEAERAKGFVRPVRCSYKHVGKPTQLVNDAGEDTHVVDLGGCGTVTTMSLAIAETYARDPKFYGSTFCCGCGKHLPVTEFVWKDTNERVGS